jgi:hypothetical protein
LVPILDRLISRYPRSYALQIPDLADSRLHEAILCASAVC